MKRLIRRAGSAASLAVAVAVCCSRAAAVQAGVGGVGAATGEPPSVRSMPIHHPAVHPRLGRRRPMSHSRDDASVVRARRNSRGDRGEERRRPPASLGPDDDDVRSARVDAGVVDGGRRKSRASNAARARRGGDDPPDGGGAIVTPESSAIEGATPGGERGDDEGSIVYANRAWSRIRRLGNEGGAADCVAGSDSRRRDDSHPNAQRQQQSESESPRPRMTIEFDTQATFGGSSTRGGRGSGRRRGKVSTTNERVDEWNSFIRGPGLSISFDAFPRHDPPPLHSAADGELDGAAMQQQQQQYSGVKRQQTTVKSNKLLAPAISASLAILTQTISVLPALLLSRRVLNAVATAVVDYFRGRIFRQTFNRLERAYLRYYEFPAATRATARLVSQIVILLGLSWTVRWWMILVLLGNNVGPMVLGVTGSDLGMVGAASSSTSTTRGDGWKVVGLPCHGRGRGVAYLCGLFWIGSVVGIGHVLAMGLSVWGGPLRLQATAQHSTENPRHVLRRIILHPIIWFRGLEEWKHLPSFENPLRRCSGRTGHVNIDRKQHSDGGRQQIVYFNPDPLLFPATWLPLCWLQMLAVAKAFSTDPLKYRWCSPEDDRVAVPKLMKQYLVQLALKDEWRRVFLGERRVGLGILVVLSYLVALVWMACTAFTLDGGAAAMLIPSILAAIISGIMNIVIFWSRLGTRSQRKALHAMGLT